MLLDDGDFRFWNSDCGLGIWWFAEDPVDLVDPVWELMLRLDDRKRWSLDFGIRIVD